MMLDLSEYPLVRVLERNTTTRQIERLLDREERFVIMMTRPSERNSADTLENRRSRSKFFKPLWHIMKKAPRGTCFRLCNVQVAEAVGFEPTVRFPVR